MMSDKREQNTLTGVEWIDKDPLFLAMGASLNKDAPQGDDLEDNELFDEVDTEMMKRGTLNHSTIRWDWVCEQCAQLLQTEAKDFRLLLYSLQCLPYTKSHDAPLTLGAVLTSRFIGIWGDIASPTAKKRVPIIRKIVDALEALYEHSTKLNIRQENIPLTTQSLKQSVDFFKEIDQELGLRILSLPNKIEAATLPDEDDGSQSLEKILKEPFKPKPILEVKDKGGNISALELHPENLVLDSKNERALKQSLTVVADFILTMDVDNPLSYRLRRFATWYGIKEPPEQRRKESPKTVILPVSANALEEYRIAAERGQMDFEIAQKLERSCHNQPFWIDGQYLAYKLALICNRKNAASAIYEVVHDFVNKTPWLEKLQFADGSPFISDETKQWIENYQKPSSMNSQTQDNEMIGDNMQNIVRLAREKASQGQTNEAIKLLEDSKPNGQSVRSHALWEMLMLECLSDWGMKNLVSSQAERLHKDIENLSVKDFEPEILDRLQHLNNQSSY